MPSEILRDVPPKPTDHVVAEALIRAHHVAQDFGIEPAREPGRLREVAEHDGELSALGLRGTPRGEGDLGDVSGGGGPGTAGK